VNEILNQIKAVFRSIAVKVIVEIDRLLFWCGFDENGN
jgi:hypothetical protein